MNLKAVIMEIRSCCLASIQLDNGYLDYEPEFSTSR